MAPLLEIEDLEISFGRGSRCVRCTQGVHLTVERGEIVCLVGESGCGKSITALSVLGLLSARGSVTAGSIRFEGRELTRRSPRELDAIRGPEIAMIFQDIMYSLNPVLTIGRQLEEGMRVHLGMTREQARARAVELMDRMGIPEAESMLRRYPHQLSGGMRQRVMIAMALSCKPKLLIADEPTTALDVTIQLQLMQLLRRLRDEEGMSILLITHDIGVVTEMADRVVVMYAGQCVESCTCERLLEAPAHPYTAALLRSVPGIHDDRSVRLASIPGTVPEHYQDMEGCRFAPRCPRAAGCDARAEYLEPEPGHEVYCSRRCIGEEVEHRG